MRRKKKRNILKRNSGFIVGCMLTAGVSFFAADIVMSQQMDLFTSLFESEEDPIVIDKTKPSLAPEAEENRAYETDAFTITAAGTVIKGVETDASDESDPDEQDTPETDEEGNPVRAEDGESGDSEVNEGSSDQNGDASENDGSQSDGSSGSDSGYDDSYNSNSDSGSSGYDGSYNDNSYNDSSNSGSSNNDNWYEGPNIEIEDSGNGDHYYDDSGNNSWDSSWDDSGSGSGSSSGGNSDVIVEGEPADILLPGISTRYITESELYNYSDSMIRYIRNEIFAIHGRIFKSEDLREYFMSKSWYTPMYAPEDFDACMFSILNNYEIANLEVILKYEEALAAAN